MKEAKPGHERLKLLMKAFDAPTPAPALGNPVSGPSAYEVCVYDGTDDLVGSLRIDRAEDTCGTGGRSCWRSLPGGGFKYADAELAAHGARRLLVRGGTPGGGRVVLVAKNAVQHGRLAMPTGLAASLAGNARATVQVVVSDGACFTMDAAAVRQATPVVFRALAD